MIYLVVVEEAGGNLGSLRKSVTFWSLMACAVSRNIFGAGVAVLYAEEAPRKCFLVYSRRYGAVVKKGK